MGFGNCVLVNNSPANLEVVGDAGAWFEDKEGPSDLLSRLEYLLSHPDVVADYRDKVVERVRKVYSWEAVTEQYEQLFERLLQGEDVTARK
jgi:glycosyltransferase involved in cell wall biosynthesis